MAHALQETIRWNDIICGGTSYGRKFKNVWGHRWGIGKHSPAHEIKATVGTEVWNEYYTFTIVRHPIQRVLSMYHWTGRIIENQGWKRWTRFFSSWFGNSVWEWPTVIAYLETSSFSEYLRHPGFSEARIATPQYTYIADESGEDIILDQLLYLESINEEFDILCSKIGVDMNLPRKNVAARNRDIKVSNRDIVYIGSLYKKDFSFLRYDTILAN